MSGSADRYITIFSPEGQIWQVNFAAKAVKQSEITAIAAKGTNAVVVCVEKKITNPLIDSSTVTHMFRITPHVGACLVGLPADISYVSRYLKYYAANFKYEHGFEIPVSLLSTRLSEVHQQESQYVGLRPTAVSAIIFGYDAPSDDFALFKVLPSGSFSGYKAVASGSKEIEVMQVLEKALKPADSQQSSEEQLQQPPPVLVTPGNVADFVMKNFESVLSDGYKDSIFEMAVITKENTKYHLLQGQKADELLEEASHL